MHDEPTSGPLPGDAAQPDAPSWEPAPPSVISVGQLTAHPGNVRQDLDLTPEFLASVAEMGVRVVGAENVCHLGVCAVEAVGSVPARGGRWPVRTRGGGAMIFGLWA